MGYPALFITWIICCVDTAAFSVSVNGDLEGFFSSSRGIRQGCSLSPYLFVVISNVLSKLLNSAVLNRRIGYHPLCASLNLTHLSFADDIMVFTNGSAASLDGVLEVFAKFARISGLCINVAKSTVFAAGVDKESLQEKTVSVGFSISGLPIKYLGLPLTTKTLTRNNYEPLVAKIKARFQSWTSKTLSFAGRLMLIKDTGLGSWVWRRLLRLRSTAKQFLSMEVHNGQATRFWTDIWHPRGRLIEIVGETGTLKLGIARSALICDVRNETGWSFRRSRARQIRDLITMVEAHPLAENRLGQDVVLWRKNETDFCNHFSTSVTWQRIRTHKPTQEWSKVIWFSLGVPHFAFITWLVVRNRLSTGDRMRAWGQVQGCLFCGEPDETRDHLYFACPYTYTIWLEVVGTLLGRPPDPD
ncbi:uncharacterized protein LOC108838378 [Raphanus sativus]|uniref:Uncharacterized protein LOC108838378 n=1 Tax=Raphanus sativus TaxID=3726 RepID=A0A9W3D8Z5_RAPSA|nr:uncharacterized protein LOC108838378 [Raphanus sativus]